MNDDLLIAELTAALQAALSKMLQGVEVPAADAAIKAQYDLTAQNAKAEYKLAVKAAKKELTRKLTENEALLTRALKPAAPINCRCTTAAFEESLVKAAEQIPWQSVMRNRDLCHDSQQAEPHILMQQVGRWDRNKKTFTHWASDEARQMKAAQRDSDFQQAEILVLAQQTAQRNRELSHIEALRRGGVISDKDAADAQVEAIQRPRGVFVNGDVDPIGRLNRLFSNSFSTLGLKVSGIHESVKNGKLITRLSLWGGEGIPDSRVLQVLKAAYPYCTFELERK